MLKFVIKIKNKGEPDSKSWEEEYDTEEGRWMSKNQLDSNDPDEYGRNLVAFFNNTLRKGQEPREFVSARKIE